MADQPSESSYGHAQGNDQIQMLRRRRVMLGIGLLLMIVVICVAAILTMLDRLEARNATFQPPMTALERQRLLPQDPVLDAAPKLDGLRYRNQVERSPEDFSPVQNQQDDQPPLSHALILRADDLRADARSDLHPARQTP